MMADGKNKEGMSRVPPSCEAGPETYPGGASHNILSANGLPMNKQMSAMSANMEIKNLKSA